MVEPIYQCTINRYISPLFPVKYLFCVCLCVWLYFLLFSGHFNQLWCTTIVIAAIQTLSRTRDRCTCLLFPRWIFNALRIFCYSVHTICMSYSYTIGSNSEHNRNNSSFRFFVESNQAICPKGWYEIFCILPFLLSFHLSFPFRPFVQWKKEERENNLCTRSSIKPRDFR